MMATVRDLQIYRVRRWEGRPLVHHLYGRAGHIQPGAQVLRQHRDGHLPGDAQVGLLQDPLPGAWVLALQQPSAMMQIQTLKGSGMP